MNADIFSEGGTPRLVSMANCTGTEASLLDCMGVVTGTGTGFTCPATSGVICQGTPFLHSFTLIESTVLFLASGTAAGDCSTGDIRLMNATDTSTTRAGRLEVCINNAWGTVCDDRFNSLDAAVACTQLEGFNSSG